MEPLSSDPVSAVTPEKKSQELINEWLKSYFDGNPHEIAGESLTFDDLVSTPSIFFNQTQLPSQMVNAIIHWQFSDIRSTERMESQTSKLITVDFLSTVYVRTVASNKANKADFDCRRVADLLRALVQSPERHRLNQAGIHHIRLQRGPVPIPVSGYQSRMLVITGQLQYRIEWEEVPPVAAGN